MWSLRYVIVSGQPKQMGQINVSIPSFNVGITKTSHDDLLAALGDGWEPFSVAPLSTHTLTVWFRKQVVDEPPSVEELPGQYL